MRDKNAVRQQVDCDLRITRQREEIRRLAQELSIANDRIEHWQSRFTRRKEWVDKESSFWKLTNLESRNRELVRRVIQLQDILRGSVSDRSIKRAVLEAMKDVA